MKYPMEKYNKCQKYCKHERTVSFLELEAFLERVRTQVTLIIRRYQQIHRHKNKLILSVTDERKKLSANRDFPLLRWLGMNTGDVILGLFDRVLAYWMDNSRWVTLQKYCWFNHRICSRWYECRHQTTAFAEIVLPMYVCFLETDDWVKWTT